MADLVLKHEDKVKEIVESIPKPILSKIFSWKVERAAITLGVQMTVTSKIHTFKPKVEIPVALDWLVEENSVDASLIFDNDCSLSLKDGKFESFDDLS